MKPLSIRGLGVGALVAITAGRFLGAAVSRVEPLIEGARNLLPPPPPLLRCRAYPSEEYEPFHLCPAGTESLASWCSGDCNADDAKVQICCQWGRK